MTILRICFQDEYNTFIGVLLRALSNSAFWNRIRMKKMIGNGMSQHRHEKIQI
jgi:hypothetical protein